MERPVHHCPCPDCQLGTGPVELHADRLTMPVAMTTGGKTLSSRPPVASGAPRS
ncbi:MAG: hypothetical protein U0804_02575 [Gemmataceae bacterium]